MTHGNWLERDAVINEDVRRPDYLEPGRYRATVKTVTWGIHSPTYKIPKCEKAVVRLAIPDEIGEEVTLSAELYLHSCMEWKLSEFFRSVGLKDYGEDFRMDWDAVPGRECIVLVDNYMYTTEEGESITRNYIKKFLDGYAYSGEDV